ncbi:MAG TPA: hydrogenase [Blastocatellia bacterium]|nr:hydrogenase [Blastocatellia bacterium]
MESSDTARRLFWHGIFLFLLGLISGLVVPLMVNPRMGLSSHLGGVINGTFLVVLGLIWGHLKLAQRLLSATFWLAIYSTYGAGWAAALLGGIFGTSSATPIAGAGHTGQPWQENLVNFLLYTGALAIILVCVFVLWGLRKNAATKAAAV